MTFSPVDESDSRLTRVCAFTVATALAWVGHECTGSCPPDVWRLPASVWFRRDPAVGGGGWNAALVVVELAQGRVHADLGGVLQAVNRCTSPEHIVVCERARPDRDLPASRTVDDTRLYLRVDDGLRRQVLTPVASSGADLPA